MRRSLVALATLGLVVGAGACSSDDTTADSTAVTITLAATTMPPATTLAPATTSSPPTSTTTTTSSTTTTTTSRTTTTTTTSTTSTTTTTTLVPLPLPDGIEPIDALAFPTDVEVEIGRSVEGRPITVIRRGDPTGTRVLAVGVIHGNEADGIAIVDRLAVEPVPPGVELWLVRSMNPDGQARSDRQNANAVDLNRNFPENWDVLGEPGFWQYGGSAPASEPETRAMVALGASVQPHIVLWYHQDLFRIAPGSGRSGEIRTRYADIAGLPIVDITGGTYTGTASQWSRTVIPEAGVGITVELGETLSEEQIVAHVAAVHAIATEYS
jgi:murein peptide amidase A